MNEINKVEDVTSSRGAQWMGASGIIALAAQSLLDATDAAKFFDGL